jgi:hypothetical protein
VTQYLLIVRPTHVGMLHSMLSEELARRLQYACTEASCKARPCSSRELLDMSAEELRDLTLIIVNARLCATTSGNTEGFLSQLTSARKVILASAEPAQSPWYKAELNFLPTLDAVFDVGFTSQEEEHDFPDVAYHFVFNGPTSTEKEAIAELPPARERPIPWALVGHPTPGRLALAARLMEEFAAGGFVYLPGKPNQSAPVGATRQPRLGKHEKIGASGLAAVLRQTNYYVWNSAHDFAHYESMRFVAALGVGAIPCKIASGEISQGLYSQGLSHVPGVFPSPQSFCAAAHREGAQALYQRARDFYLSKSLLATYLEKALERV